MKFWINPAKKEAAGIDNFSHPVKRKSGMPKACVTGPIALQ